MPMIPTDSEITQAVQSLFSASASLDRNARWNALVPTDLDLSAQPLPQGQKQISFVPYLEFREVNAFVDYFGKLVVSSGRIDENAIRLMLMVYCHIMESDFWPTLVWNKLRLLAEKQPSWHFTHKTRKGNNEVCVYPKDKFKEIRDLAGSVHHPIGDVISRIWDSNLRNAFSHSCYMLTDRFIPTKWISPISRKGAFKASSKPRSESYSFNEVRDFYRSARTLLVAVASEHSKAWEELNKSFLV